MFLSCLARALTCGDEADNDHYEGTRDYNNLKKSEDEPSRDSEPNNHGEITGNSFKKPETQELLPTIDEILLILVPGTQKTSQTTSWNHQTISRRNPPLAGRNPNRNMTISMRNTSTPIMPRTATHYRKLNLPKKLKYAEKRKLRIEDWRRRNNMRYLYKIDEAEEEDEPKEEIESNQQPENKIHPSVALARVELEPNWMREQEEIKKRETALIRNLKLDAKLELKLDPKQELKQDAAQDKL